jgi:hypothetical protein
MIQRFSAKESADFSAITTWGIFQPVENEMYNVILLDAIKGRWEFPTLKEEAMKQHKYWDPET